MSPRRTRPRLCAAGLLVVVVLVAACSSSSSPSCSGALGHYYALGCSLSIAGVPLDQTDAIAQCEETQADFAMPSESTECPCAAQFQAELACCNDAADAGCTDCTTQVDAYGTCLAENAGCST